MGGQIEKGTRDPQNPKKWKYQPLTKASVNRCLSSLHRALQIGVDEDPPIVLRIPKFPWQDESDNVRQGVLSPLDYRKLRDALPPHSCLALVIGYHVGLRRSAILGLKWAWVDLEAKVITIPNTDTGTKKKPREVPIYGEMLPYLEMAKAERDAKYPNCEWVIAEKGRRVKNLKTAWRSACQRENIPTTLFHDLRRTALSNMEEAGVNRADAMNISGHKLENVYRRYLIGNRRKVNAVGKRMEQFHADQAEVLAPPQKAWAH